VISAATDIPLAVVGCDFRIASSRWRSRLVLDDAEQRRIAGELSRSKAADGFVDLSTCNRNEWIVSSERPEWAAQLLRTLMLDHLGAVPGRSIEPYVFVGEAAARHLLRVAMGRESLVVGERQIAGQFFHAIEAAQARDTSSRILNGLIPIAGRLVRSANRCGCLANANRGVHSLAVSYTRAHLGNGVRRRIAVVGLGEIGRRVRGVLEAEPGVEVVACNRTLPADGGGGVRPLSELAALLCEVEAAIVCTGAPAPVVQAEQLPRDRGERPLLLVDIGIPEQVARVDGAAGVERVGLDELVAAHSTDGDVQRGQEEADRLVERAAEQFRRFCHEPDFVEILEAVRESNQQLAESEIPRFVSEHLADLPESDRSRLERELRQMLQSYTHQLFGSIKKAAERRVDRCGCQE